MRLKPSPLVSSRVESVASAPPPLIAVAGGSATCSNASRPAWPLRRQSLCPPEAVQRCPEREPRRALPSLAELSRAEPGRVESSRESPLTCALLGRRRRCRARCRAGRVASPLVQSARWAGQSSLVSRERRRVCQLCGAGPGRGTNTHR